MNILQCLFHYLHEPFLRNRQQHEKIELNEPIATMQAIKQIQALNKRELENAVYVSFLLKSLSNSLTRLLSSPPSASWHADYRDTAYVYFGGLDPTLSEGDIVTIFSQYGEPTHIRLIRDRETGKSKGFGFLKYEDQRSTDLAVDNLSGSVVVRGGMQLRVEHARYEKRQKEGEKEEEMDNVRWDKVLGVGKDKVGKGGEETDEEGQSESERTQRKRRRPLLKEEMELQALLDREDDEEDPMKEYLIKEKKAEVERALARVDDKEARKHRHRHKRRDARRDSLDDERSHDHRRYRHREEDDSDSRDRRHRNERRHHSRSRRRSRDREGESGSPPRHHRKHHERHRYRSRSRSQQRNR